MEAHRRAQAQPAVGRAATARCSRAGIGGGNRTACCSTSHLSNLDAKLRHEMRAEIRRICKTAGFTTIYVTHDQKEALSVADRIAVLGRGS
jgi:ABC-type thiamine transport system ATPase subunit